MIKFQYSDSCSQYRRLARASSTDNKDTLQTILDSQQVEKVAGIRTTEGPLWHQRLSTLSDIPANTIYQWIPDEK